MRRQLAAELYVDGKTLREIEGGGGNPVYDAFVWVRRALPF